MGGATSPAEAVEDCLEHADHIGIKRAKNLRSRMTDAEKRLWYELRAKRLSGHKFRRQHPINPYIVDFACVKHRLVVEVDGETHSSTQEMAYDRKRTLFLEDNGWHVLRFTNEDIFKDIDSVLGKILRCLPSTAAAGEVPAKQAEGVADV